MGIYQTIDIMKANGLLDIPADQPLIYIYKLTSVHTGHYYIGQTNSLKDRMYSHLMTLLNLIEGMDCNPSCFHETIAPIIKELHSKEKRVKILKFTREALSVYVLALVADRETANVVESYYIKKYSNDELCLNMRLKI